jgi:glycosyltransferase involved in cell wall biosynthesis
VTWLGDIGDDELARQYRGARCVVYASLYEGFGIPILEAMACGAPVVTSRGGATEEVAGGHATLVDPYDVASIVSGIESARTGGVEHARSFTWGETARRTVGVYEEAAG